MKVLPALALLTATLALPSTADAARPFELRYSANEPGGIAIAANTLMSCPDSDPDCAAARGGAAVNDNAFAMAPVDVDDDPTTVNSSRARFELPPGGTVLHASLYWGADRSAGAGGARAPQGTVRLKVPGETAYRPITAHSVDPIGKRYQGVADVTDVVRSARGGEYTVADVEAGTGEDRYAGWALVVAYRDPAAPVRNLAIFDGFATVNADAPELDIPVAGFRTPKVGPVRTELGFVAYEGDRASTGDGASLDGSVLSDDAKAPNNVFDSSIRGAGRTPEHLNQLGFDAFTLRADGVLANDATSATIRLTTRGETYLPAAVTFATDLHAPLVRAHKSVRNVNGGEVEPGDELEYEITVANDGQDGAEQVVVSDPVPAHTTRRDGDVRADLGSLAPGARKAVRFRVRVDDPVPAGTVIRNTAAVSFRSQTLGLALQAQTPQVESAVASPVVTNRHGAPPTSVAATTCPADVLRLVDVHPDGARVWLAGVTSTIHAGRAVTLRAGERALTTATVQPDGTFQTDVPRTGDGVRYQAILGDLRSPRLKLARRMDMTRIDSRAGTVTIAGRVSTPLARPATTVTLREYTDCRGHGARVIRSGIPVSPSGHFRVTVDAPAGASVVYYRALTRVRRTRSNPRTYPTFTLLRGTSIVH